MTKNTDANTDISSEEINDFDKQLDNLTDSLTDLIAGLQLPELDIENKKNEVPQEEDMQEINDQLLKTIVNNDFSIDTVTDNISVQQSVLDKDQKRKQKDLIIKVVRTAMTVQIIFMSIIITLVLSYVVFDWQCFRIIDNKSLSIITDLLKFYITATIAEYVAMFFFIVKSLFSKESQQKANI